MRFYASKDAGKTVGLLNRAIHMDGTEAQTMARKIRDNQGYNNEAKVGELYVQMLRDGGDVSAVLEGSEVEDSHITDAKEVFQKPVNDDNIEIVEMFRRGEDSRSGYKFINERRFDELTIEAKKSGAIIIRGTPEVERHLDHQKASASILGDVLFFRQNVRISEVLEETYHFKQNKMGMNDDKKEPIRTILNEIDAKEFILKNASKYHIPRKEIELTKKQLASYRKQLEEAGE